MTTLATMKDRIARELRRSNIETQIGEAITTAIDAYQTERFAFAEEIFDFDTVANQEFYDESDSASIPLIVELDYVKILISDAVYTLRYETPERMEFLSQNETQTGQPLVYSRYASKLRLYPVPADVYTIRIGAHLRYPAPAADATTGNFWMTTAERLIRCRAKYELYAHVTRDANLTQYFDPWRETAPASPTFDAYQQLKSLTNKLGKSEGWHMAPTNF